MNFKMRDINKIVLQGVPASHGPGQTSVSAEMLSSPSLVEWSIFIELKLQEARENI